MDRGMVATASRIKIVAGLLYTLWALAFIVHNTPMIGGHPVFFLFDDGMISMRYAANFVAGDGLVWNPGEYVEGYTNPLWTLVMAGAIAGAGKSIAPLVIELIGLMLSLATCAIGAQASVELSFHMTKQTGRVDDGHLATTAYYVTFFLIATTYPLTFWSLTGMEVSLVACLTTLAALISVRAFSAKIAPPRALALLCLIATVLYFTRPDAPVNVIPLVLATGYLGWQIDRLSTLKVSAVGLLLAAAAAGAHLLWRYSYYGILLPNTYVLKVEGYDVLLRWSNGVHFLRKFFLSYFPLVLLDLALVLRWKRSPLVAALGGTLFLALLYQVQVGGDPWPYWRQLAPALVLAYIVLGEAGARFACIAPLRRFRLWSVSLVAVMLALLSDSRFLGEMSFRRPAYGTDYMVYLARAGLALRDILQPDGTVLAFWAGELPYLWEGPALDALGKSDRHIATLKPHATPNWDGMRGVPGHSKYDLRYSILEKRPDYIQFSIWGDDDVSREIADLYVLADAHGVPLCLRKESPRVRWDQVRIVGPCVS
jgi:arabinofuranosyltransferase